VPAPRKYDEETRAHAVRMYEDRIRDLGESKVTARRAVGAVLDINASALRNWIEREEIDTGARPGVTTEVSEEVRALRREGAELPGRTRSSRPPRPFSPRRSSTADSAQVIVDYMAAHADRFGVEPICRVLTEHGMPIAPSTYYARLTSPVSAAELADASAITGPLRQPQVRTSDAPPGCGGRIAGRRG